MNSLKLRKKLYYILFGGCAFFTLLYLSKILENISNVSLIEVGLTFLFIVSTVICTALIRMTTEESML